MGRRGCAGETGRNRVGGYCDPVPRDGAERITGEPAREGRQADDPRTDHKREQRQEGGPMMKFRSKAHRRACPRGGERHRPRRLQQQQQQQRQATTSTDHPGAVTQPGSIGAIPAAGTPSGTAGSITYGYLSADAPNWILPITTRRGQLGLQHLRLRLADVAADCTSTRRVRPSPSTSS